MTEPYSVQYAYDSSGSLVGAVVVAVVTLPPSPSGDAYPKYSRSVDAIGDITETWSLPSLEIVAGDVKLHSAVVETRTGSVDGSVTVTKAILSYDPI